MCKHLNNLKNPAAVFLLALAIGWSLDCTEVFGQYGGGVPKEGQGIDVKERIGEYVNGNIGFYDEYNNHVRLADYLNNDRPIMLSFNYSNCPQLCHTQLREMSFALKDIGLVPGKDFEIVSISIDPNEQVVRARETKQKYLDFYDRPETANGWHFLTGKNKNIKKQAESVGVSYKYIRETNTYSHSAVFIMISPEGKIVRYVYGLSFEPKTIELALTEAGEGKIGSSINKGFLLTGCFLYNKYTGKYTFRWMRLMQWAGGLTVVVLAITLIPYWIRRNNSDSNSETEKSGVSEISEQAKNSINGEHRD